MYFWKKKMKLLKIRKQIFEIKFLGKFIIPIFIIFRNNIFLLLYSG